MTWRPRAPGHLDIVAGQVQRRHLACSHDQLAAAHQQPDPPGDARRQPVAMHVPPRPQVAQEGPALGLAPAQPDGLDVRPQGIDRLAPATVG